jgi:hypothetical protein
MNARKIVSLLLAATFLLSFVSGLFLLLKHVIPFLPYPRKLHIYSSFAFSSFAILHIYYNRKVLKAYLKK